MSQEGELKPVTDRLFKDSLDGLIEGVLNFDVSEIDSSDSTVYWGDYCFASNTELLHPLRSRIEEILGVFVSENDIGKIILAIDESVANAIYHGNWGLGSRQDDPDYWNAQDALFKEAIAHPGKREDPAYADIYSSIDKRVRLQFWISNEEVKFTITDEGEGFDWRPLYERNMALLADRVKYLKFMTAKTSTGRGFLAAHYVMDISYNEKGNEITLLYNRS
jgi:hypothetical protein